MYIKAFFQEILILWSTAEGDLKVAPNFEMSVTVCVYLEACRSGHSYEDKLIGLFHR